MKQGWEIMKLGEVCNLYQPKTISGEMLIKDGKYLVYGANGVIGRYNQYNHENSEVLLTCRGATCGTINMSAPYSWINGNAMVVQPKTDNITKQFLALYLQSVDWKNVITGAAQPQITRQSLSPLTIEVPPREEQERIVEMLDREFEKIDAMKANAEQNLQHAKDLFQAALRKELQPKEGWDIKNLKNVSLRLLAGGDKPKVFSEQPTEKLQVPIYANGISRDGLVGYTDKATVECESITISARGTIGFCCIRKTPFVPIVRLITIIPTQGVKLEYLYYALNNTTFENNGVAIPQLTVPMVKKLDIPIPTMAEQEQIVARLDILNERCKALEENYKKTIALCDDMKQALLRKAFNGEL